MSDKACEQFDDFYDGWLAHDALRRYRQHLHACARCQEKLRLQKWLDEQMVDAASHCVLPTVPPTVIATRSSNWQRFGRSAVAISAVVLVVAVLITTVQRISRDEMAITEPLASETDDEGMVQVAQKPITTVSVVTDSNDYIALVDESIEEVTFVQLYPVLHSTQDD